jgi:hypothetical protein
MRRAVLLAAALAALPTAGPAQEPLEFPPGAEATAERLMPRVGPRTLVWIRQEAAREAANDTASEATAVRAVNSNRALGNLSDSDVTAIVFLVMMEAAKSAREDLKAIMAGVKQIDDAKAALRQPAQRATAAASTPRIAAPPATTALQRPVASAHRAAVQPRPMPKPVFDAQLERAKNDLDSLSEMRETESLRLQLAVDRQAKMMSTLSNLLKKMSESSSTITQNLK